MEFILWKKFSIKFCINKAVHRNFYKLLKTFLSMQKMKVLVIVAHPDDETIWMGGTLIKNKDKWNTTILSLCRKNDKDRAPKFQKACQRYNATSIIGDLDDEILKPINLEEIKKIINPILNTNYDILFTHNENGEYGHLRHIETHEAVRQMLSEKSLKSKKAFFFDYIKKSAPNTETGFDCYANKSATKFINLNNLQLLTKKSLIQEVYGFQKGGFEERNCKKQEAFREFKIKDDK